MTEALLGFVALFGLLLLGMPIGLAMLLAGLGGFASVVGLGPALAMIGQTSLKTAATYEFSVIPLFLLMGNLIARSGLSEDLYAASNALLGRRRGGLAMATILACGGFAAVCGSSLATVATVSPIALPSMRRYRYDDGLAVGSIAAGGTLGILIPPSVPLVIYGFITQTDIGKLLIAGIVPGLLGILGYLLAVLLTVRLRPDYAPTTPMKTEERWTAIARVRLVGLLFLVVLGGIYLGVFTATEAAGIGAAGAFLIAILRGIRSGAVMLDIALETARTTCILFVIVIGSFAFTNFVNVTGLPNTIAAAVSELRIPPFAVIMVIFVIFLVLGCVLETIAMMLLTVPLLFPLVTSLGYDPIWFGIIVVVAMEIGLITPPIGLNLFVMQAAAKDVPVTTVYRGVTPFILADVVRFILLAAVPWFALVLPNLM